MSLNLLNRRQWLQTSAALGTAMFGGVAVPYSSYAGETAKRKLDIGSRRQLFVDDFLIERLSGAKLSLHKPEPKEVVMVHDAPWEGNTTAYYTIFPDGDLFRMYYRGSHWDAAKNRDAHGDLACYAESTDGIRWTKPKLGLCDFKGSKENNVIWTGQGSHNFTPFKDTNPACPPDARYKALAYGPLHDPNDNYVLYAYKSPDGMHWSQFSTKPLITDGLFDSQNLAFWDAVRGEYRAYWRIFTSGIRAIRTATSKDFLHWEHRADLVYVNSPNEHLYTNAVQPYFRAPDLFIGFPTRYIPETEQVEPVFMSSRDGVLFRRWKEAIIPITAPKDRDGNRSNYMAHGLLQLPGNDRELSVYATEAYYKGPAARLRRFTFRTDGFVSIHAAAKAEILTKPLQFTGKMLSLNCQTASGGRIQVEIQDAEGHPLPKFSVADCHPITGDEIAHVVQWTDGSDLGELAGRSVRLRLVMNDTDLYSMQFQP